MKPPFDAEVAEKFLNGIYSIGTYIDFRLSLKTPECKTTLIIRTILLQSRKCFTIFCKLIATAAAHIDMSDTFSSKLVH